MAIPEKIARYEVKSVLGKGGMSTVYRAFDPLFDREVAIKVIPGEYLHDPRFRARFENEIKIIGGLEHPSIVPLYDFSYDNQQPYYVMRYMNGGSLSELIEKGKISAEETARIVEKISLGLAYSHQKGIIHRDLKPDNILFDDDGSPFISDFGIAELSSKIVEEEGIVGTPAYMSPEQAQGGIIDLRSDIYSLGVVVFHMLTGQQPYNADTPMGIVVKHITEPVPNILDILSELPPKMNEFIKTAMAKDRNERFSNSIELAKALNLIVFGDTSKLTFDTNTNKFSEINIIKPVVVNREKQKNWVILAVMGLLLLSLFFIFKHQISLLRIGLPVKETLLEKVFEFPIIIVSLFVFWTTSTITAGIFLYNIGKSSLDANELLIRVKAEHLILSEQYNNLSEKYIDLSGKYKDLLAQLKEVESLFLIKEHEIDSLVDMPSIFHESDFQKIEFELAFQKALQMLSDDDYVLSKELLLTLSKTGYNPEAVWLSLCLTATSKRLYFDYLKNIVEINPDNVFAKDSIGKIKPGFDGDDNLRLEARDIWRELKKSARTESQKEICENKLLRFEVNVRGDDK